MSILEGLTEEECYLYAIFYDRSGLDLAEFSMVDLENDDACFRAWPFQWKWWRDDSGRQIDCAARSLGKSLSIKLRAYAFPFNYPNQEMVITAPEGVHLDAITDVVETAFMNNKLARYMLAAGRSRVKHRPFHVGFNNGSRIMGRIPQHDGKAIKGTHPVVLEQDEASDYPSQGWMEIIETLKMGSENPVWRAHGVTRGVRDYFYKFTQPDSGWKVHRIVAMARPTWSDEERQAKIELYGSRDHPDYRRNVLGDHGDSENVLFVLSRLMATVDQNEDSDYNSKLYTSIKITPEKIAEVGGVLNLLDIPRTHMEYEKFWIGMDVGYINDPSEIVVFGEEK